MKYMCVYVCLYQSVALLFLPIYLSGIVQFNLIYLTKIISFLFHQIQTPNPMEMKLFPLWLYIHTPLYQTIEIEKGEE